MAEKKEAQGSVGQTNQTVSFGSKKEEAPTEEPVSSSTEEVTEVVPAQEVEEKFEVPDKFLVDGEPDLQKIVKAQQDTEKEFTKATQELADSRKLMLQINETLLKQTQGVQLETTSKETEVTNDDFWDNPKEAFQKLIQQELKPLQNNVAQNEVQAQTADFAQRHAEFVTTIEGEGQAEFQEWIKASPYRQRLAQAADQYDWAAAEDLAVGFMEDKASRKTTQETSVEEVKEERKVALQEASTVTGKGSPDSARVSLTHHDIRELQRKDPKRYLSPEFQKELMQAYAEGRVG